MNKKQVIIKIVIILLAISVSTNLLAEEDKPEAIAMEPTPASNSDKDNRENSAEGLTSNEEPDILINDPLLLHGYKPTFFLAGNDDAKFQIAFNYRIINGMGLYLGIRQMVFWDIWEVSAPFRDITFNPEFYYRFEINSSILRSIDLGLWEHDSNGSGGSHSRAWDRSYVRLNSYWNIGNFTFSYKFRFYYLYRMGYNSGNIRRYLGYWDLETSIIYNFSSILDIIALDIKVFAGAKYLTNFRKGGQEIGIKLQFKHFSPYFYFQFYNGYAEALCPHEEHVTRFRFGALIYINIQG